MSHKVSGLNKYDQTEDLEKGGYSKCTRCGKPSHGKSRCQACLDKLAAKRKKPGTKERSWQHADQALRRDRGGAGTTSGGHSKGKGNRQEIQRKMKAAESKAGEKLSLDRRNNDRGYEAKNTRAVPQALNRGRHHVDEKKLRAWKKRLKKHDLTAEEFYTLMKAKFAADEAVSELIKSIGPDGLEQYIDLFDVEEDMEKGAMNRVAPITPETQAAVESHQGPISHIHEGGESGRKSRERIPRLEGAYRTRGLFNLHKRTRTRMNQDNKREFLLHRIMSPEEHEKHINNKIDTKTSWTPNHSWLKENNADGEKILSAWIPEDHIHHILRAVPKHNFNRDFDHENEIVVNPHQLQIDEEFDKEE